MRKIAVRKIMLQLALQLLVVSAFAQDGNLTPPAAGETATKVLADIQAKVNAVQSMQATLEFDEKDEDDDKKKKKKKKNSEPEKPQSVNPKWPEPPGRDVERGPLFIQRRVGAYLRLQRKEDVAEYVANGASIWKYDHKDKEARHIPANWPVVDTYISNALVMNVFVAMEPDTIKLLGSENVAGTPCWVMEGKSPSKLTMLGVEQVKLKIWVGKADGIPRIIKAPGEDDVIIRLLDLRLNQPVDASKFNFTPPAGVKTKNVFGF
jgi:outer membrane lipoprotein-sorting protein